MSNIPSNGMSLLEELRFTADAYARNYSDHKHTPALLRTAAATIERLEMRLKRHEPVSLYNGRDIDSWKSEAERLRAALTEVADALEKDGRFKTTVPEIRKVLSGDSHLKQQQAIWDAMYAADGGMGELSLQGYKIPPRPSTDETSVLHEGVRQSYLKACEISLASGLLGDGDRSDLLELYESLWPRAPVDVRSNALRGSAQETEPPLCNCGEFCNKSIGSPFTGTCRRTANGLPVKASTPHVHIWIDDDGVAVCSDCKETADDWFCPTSPTKLCRYTRTHDACDFCGQPEERK